MSDKFYLGRLFDPVSGKISTQPLLYDPADLTTHAVVTGMTGSGKTGLCIDMMEEAALQGIPAILIDPKGDLTNLLLHFPALDPQDFQPWLDPDLARRAGKSVEQAAQDAASAWKKGLAAWEINQERLDSLKNAVGYAVYTPGSDAGIPVSILSSLAAPGLDWAENREIIGERISSTVTAILGLVGLDDIDPLRSREHILLSNIFQSAWSRNISLDLTELILQVQNPPFDKLGAFPVDTFFPVKDRMALALQINNILAAPSFEMWCSGESLDIQAILFTRDGKPRQSVFYLAHLSDAERMFFVTILFSAIEAWMRTLPGTASLRALLYMDEIFGYLPPTAEPPSKQPLLRMLKTARAFGLGIILATQNPVDLDYKALSNAGTWFIGKLQTEQDKQRLLDGLESAAEGALDRGSIDRLISTLGRRMFIMQNVHEKKPVVFETRWTMSFLAGPLTRAQIPALNELVGVGKPKSSIQPAGEESPPLDALQPIPTPLTAPSGEAEREPVKPPEIIASLTRPVVPSVLQEFFLPLNLGFTRALELFGKTMPPSAAQSGITYRPSLVAQAHVRFLDRRYGLDMEQMKSVLVTTLDRRGVVRWENFIRAVPDEADMDPAPDPQARFGGLNELLPEPKQLAALRKDFTDWVYRNSKVVIRSNPSLGIFATPEVSQAEFIKTCTEAARQERDRELGKSVAGLERQISAIKEKLAKETRELQQDKTELSERKREEFVSGAETMFSLLGGKRSRRISEAMSKHRMTEQSKAEVEESLDSIEAFERKLEELEAARQQTLEDITAKWGAAVNDITEISIPAKKTGVYASMFGIAWMPHYQVRSGSELLEIPAFR